MATPMESVRKSWSKTRRGAHSQRRPGFLKLPTSSRFLLSTLTIGRHRRWKRSRNSARYSNWRLRSGLMVLATKTHGSSGWPYVDSTMFAELETAALSFVQRTFGTDSPYYKQLQFDKAWSYLSRTPYIIGALKACRDELAGGWGFTTRGDRKS